MRIPQNTPVINLIFCLWLLLQVGSFEEVLMRMSASEGGELAAWSQVMFVAPGLLQQAQQGRALEAPGGKKK
jgi:hypothetical protein